MDEQKLPEVSETVEPTVEPQAGTVSFADSLKARARYHARQVIDHLWGPSGSVILHILLLLALVRLVTFNTRSKEPEIEVMVVKPDAQDLEDFNRDLDKLKPDQPDIKPPDAQFDVEQPPDVENFNQTPEPDLAALDIRTDVQSPLIMEGLFSGRGAMRKSLLKKYAGPYGDATESAVLRALEWLKEHQNEDGSWSAEKEKYKTAMTGLGLLTFLAHAETTSSKRYGQTVEKAIRFLLENVRGDGTFASGEDRGYGHGIATYALSEAYALTRIPSIRPAMQRAAGRIVQGQEPNGGFDYGLRSSSARRDSSVMGWQTQAMKAAFIAGADIPGLKEAIDKVAACYMTTQYSPQNNMFRYATVAGKDGGAGRKSNTAMGTLCLQLVGYGERPETRAGVQALGDEGCVWGEAGDLGGHPLYCWYYLTQVKFHAGEKVFKAWNDKFAQTLVGAQNNDGSWTPFAKAEQGIGPVYGTTFCALTLMVYYRVLPTYQPIEIKAPPTTSAEDDAHVEIL